MSRRGFTILEATLALGLLAIALVMVAQLATQALAERIGNAEFADVCKVHVILFFLCGCPADGLLGAAPPVYRKRRARARFSFHSHC